MVDFYEDLKNYFENTPKEVLERDWKEREYLNEIGPDVMEYAKSVEENYGVSSVFSDKESEDKTQSVSSLLNTCEKEMV